MGERRVVMASPKTTPIAEVFGPTIQGEGALAGQPTYFIRVGGCDYACLWCDSAHAVLAPEVRLLPRLTAKEIFDAVTTLPPGPRWVTISGGNPALYDLTRLKDMLQGAGKKVAVETQGSKWQPWLASVDLLTISPKPPSSGMTVRESLGNLQGFLTQLLDTWRPMDPSRRYAVLKVVVFDDEDYKFASEVHYSYPEFPFYLSVGTAMGGLSGQWIAPLAGEGEDKFSAARANPEGWTTRGISDNAVSLLARYSWLAEKVKGDVDMQDAAVFPQLHVLLWGHARGV